jgi:hypothetical protein
MKVFCSSVSDPSRKAHVFRDYRRLIALVPKMLKVSTSKDQRYEGPGVVMHVKLFITVRDTVNVESKPSSPQQLPTPEVQYSFARGNNFD